jgi:hypothetical protein
MSEAQKKDMLKRFLAIVEILLKAGQNQVQNTAQAINTEKGEQNND